MCVHVIVTHQFRTALFKEALEPERWQQMCLCLEAKLKRPRRSTKMFQKFVASWNQNGGFQTVSDKLHKKQFRSLDHLGPQNSIFALIGSTAHAPATSGASGAQSEAPGPEAQITGAFISNRRLTRTNPPAPISWRTFE